MIKSFLVATIALEMYRSFPIPSERTSKQWSGEVEMYATYVRSSQSCAKLRQADMLLKCVRVPVCRRFYLLLLQ
jgi:hypothetical protein